MAANAVVVPVPDPLGFYSNYGSKTSFVLGGIQIFVGVCMFIIDAVGGDFGFELGITLLFSIITIVAGSLGIAAGKRKTTCPIVAFMVMSIIVSVIATFAFFANGVQLTRILISGYLGGIVAVMFLLAVAYLVELIVSIWAVVICCRVIGCGRRQTPGAVLSYHPVKCEQQTEDND